MVSNVKPVTLPEPLSSLLEVCGTAPANTPLAHGSDGVCDSGSKLEICMKNYGLRDEQFSLVQSMCIKQKRKLRSSPSPTSAIHDGVHGNSKISVLRILQNWPLPPEAPPLSIPDK